MKRTILTILILSIPIFFFGQSANNVEQIRMIVEQINNDSAYTEKTLDNEQWMEHMTDGGGQLTGFFKDGHLKKIVKRVGLSSCTSIYEYYFQDSNLIFVYGQEKVFPYVDSIGTFDYTTQTLGMESRFYFDNGKLIKTKFTGKTRCSREPSESQAPGLIVDSKRYSDRFKK